MIPCRPMISPLLHEGHLIGHLCTVQVVCVDLDDVVVHRIAIYPNKWADWHKKEGINTQLLVLRTPN